MPDTPEEQWAELRRENEQLRTLLRESEERHAAHIDTLTAAVERLAADCVNDHAGIPYYVINELDRIAAMSNGEPRDA
jgi:hypothetical protein